MAKWVTHESVIGAAVDAYCDRYDIKDDRLRAKIAGRVLERVQQRRMGHESAHTDLVDNVINFAEAEGISF